MVVKCALFILSTECTNSLLGAGAAMSFLFVTSWKACSNVKFDGAFTVDILGIPLCNITKCSLIFSISVWLIMFFLTALNFGVILEVSTIQVVNGIRTRFRLYDGTLESYDNGNYTNNC